MSRSLCRYLCPCCCPEKDQDGEAEAIDNSGYKTAQPHHTSDYYRKLAHSSDSVPRHRNQRLAQPYDSRVKADNRKSADLIYQREDHRHESVEPRREAILRNSVDSIDPRIHPRSQRRVDSIDSHGVRLYHSINHPIYILNRRIRFYSDNNCSGGNVVWTGTCDRTQSPNRSDILLLVKLDRYHPDARRDAIFHGQCLHDGQSDYGYVLVSSRAAQPIEIAVGDYCSVSESKGEQSDFNGFVRIIMDNGMATIHPMDNNYADEDTLYIHKALDYFLHKIPPPTSKIFRGSTKAIQSDNFKYCVGRNKGIQGKANSCYLDSFLFSFFAFSDVLEEELYLLEEKDDMIIKVAEILCHHIVNPLRTFLYVSHEHVEILRRHLVQQTRSAAYFNEQRDIQEILENFFGRILRMNAFVKTGTLNGDLTQFTDSFCIETFLPDNPRIPTVEQILEYSSVSMSFCIEDIPKCFLLQLPRETNHSITVIPSMEININNILLKTTKYCHSCNKTATIQDANQLKNCDITTTFFCDSCAIEKHLNMMVKLGTPDGSECTTSTVFNMTALICIESSHYNCFVRCGRGKEEKWAFFDSMIDQECVKNSNGDRLTYNIPEIRFIQRFRTWVEIATGYVERGESLQSFLDSLENEKYFDLRKRIFTCPYAIIYERQEHFE